MSKLEKNIQSYNNFKKRIISNIDSVDLDFECGYCYKHALTDMFKDTSYWTMCYRFIKQLAKERGVKTYR